MEFFVITGGLFVCWIVLGALGGRGGDDPGHELYIRNRREGHDS